MARLCFCKTLDTRRSQRHLVSNAATSLLACFLALIVCFVLLFRRGNLLLLNSTSYARSGREMVKKGRERDADAGERERERGRKWA